MTSINVISLSPLMYCYQENINLIPTVGCNNNSNGNNAYRNKNLNDKIIVHEEQFTIEL